MGEAVMISVTAALGLFALGLGMFVFGKPPPARFGREDVAIEEPDKS
jgi:hypothetical protein